MTISDAIAAGLFTLRSSSQQCSPLLVQRSTFPQILDMPPYHIFGRIGPVLGLEKKFLSQFLNRRLPVS